MSETPRKHTTTRLSIELALPPWKRAALTALRAAEFLAALYLFLLSITLMGASLGDVFREHARTLLGAATNPAVGLLVGILATSLVQSSSATTSMVVALVGADVIDIRSAVPVVMGANIGTTVTCALVSLGHVTRKEEFRRAMSSSLVHDLFNLITVAILLPLELATHFLERSAEFLGDALMSTGAGGARFRSPLKVILSPAKEAILDLFGDLFGKGEGGKLSVAAGVLILVVSLALLFVTLYLMSRVMRRFLAGRADKIIDRTIGRAPVLGILIGAVLTAIVQSSSAVTSILVPLAGAGILTVEQVFPITLGANIGTTVTAILAALAVGPLGLRIALVHLLFNFAGVLLVYPIPPVRRIPIRLARRLADLFAESKGYAVAFVLGAFFVGPGLLIFVSKLF